MPSTHAAALTPGEKTKQAVQSDAAKVFFRHYHVTSVNKIQPPTGADGNWYGYVLDGGRSPITGMRRGTMKEVTEYAKRCAAELNERNNGRSPSAWAPRKGKQS